MIYTTEETRKKVAIKHIRDVRTISSLSAEYGVAKATISNWVKAYREEARQMTKPNQNLNCLKRLGYSENKKQNWKRKMTF